MQSLLPSENEVGRGTRLSCPETEYSRPHLTGTACNRELPLGNITYQIENFLTQLERVLLTKNVVDGGTRQFQHGTGCSHLEKIVLARILLYPLGTSHSKQIGLLELEPLPPSAYVKGSVIREFRPGTECSCPQLLITARFQHL